MIKETFSVDGPAEIEISASSGSITVDAGAPGTVEVEVDTRESEAWRVHQSGTTISVTYERGLIDRGGRARVRVVAPERSTLNAYTASADVRAMLDLTRASVATASGDILLGNCDSASLKTASGDVTLGEVEGDLAARSASGDVKVRRIGGRASLTTVSGDVIADQVDGDLAVSTASGDVRVQRYLGDDLEASSISGDMAAGLPPGRTVKLQAKTLSGSVRLPDRKQSTDGKGPEISVRFKSVSGDLRITRTD